MRQNTNAILGLLLLIICSGCVKDKDEPVWSLQVGDKLPDFEVTLNNGSRVSTESLNGFYSVIVFFNTSCEDCRRELPEMQKYYELCMMQNRPITFLCISREEEEVSVEAYWKEHGFTMPYSAQNDRSVYNLFASSGIPRVYEADTNLKITRVTAE